MSELLKAHAKLGYALAVNIIRTSLVVAAVTIGFHYWGLHGVIWGLALVSVPTAVVFLIGVGRTVPELRWSEWRYFALVVVLTGLVVGLQLWR